MEGYFSGPDRTKYYFKDLGERIRREYPHLVGEHIFEQLDALGVREPFEQGRTPMQLPFSFSDTV